MKIREMKYAYSCWRSCDILSIVILFGSQNCLSAFAVYFAKVRLPPPSLVQAFYRMGGEHKCNHPAATKRSGSQRPSEERSLYG